MWGLFRHLRSRRSKSNPVCSLFFVGLNQLPLATTQAEARRKKFSSDLLGQVQGIFPKGPRRLSGFCWQLIDENQTRFLVPVRRSLRLGHVSGALTSCTKKVRPYGCLQQRNPDTLFLRKAMSVHLSPVGSSKMRPRHVGRSGGKSQRCRSKD